MSDSPISGLPAAAALKAADLGVVVQDGITKHTTMPQERAFANAALERVLVTVNRALALGDLGRLLYNNSAVTAVKITLPAVADTTLEANAAFYIAQEDLATVEVEAPAGVTINGLDNSTVTTLGTKQLFILTRNADAWNFFALSNAEPFVELPSPAGGILDKHTNAINVPGVAPGSYVFNLASTAQLAIGQKLRILQTKSSATHNVVLNAVGGTVLNGVADSQIDIDTQGEMLELVRTGANEFFASITSGQVIVNTLQEAYDGGTDILLSTAQGGITFISQQNTLTGAVINAAGTGYQVNDILSVAGGTATITATIRVLTVGGANEILTASLENTGVYTADPVLTANSVTGGAGAGATFDLSLQNAGGVFFDPGDAQALDMSACTHGSLTLPLVPTTQETPLETKQGSAWFNSTGGVINYSDGASKFTVAHTGQVGTETLQSAYDGGADIDLTLSGGGIPIFSQQNSIDGAVINAAGINYSVDDFLSVAGGTSSITATIRVNSIGGSGEILTASIENSGVYTVDPTPTPANPVTGGTGTGATFDLGLVNSGGIFIDPAGTGSFDMSACQHGGIVLPRVPTTQETPLISSGGIVWFNTSDQTVSFSTDTMKRNVATMNGIAVDEGAVTFGNANGDLDWSLTKFFFNPVENALAIGTNEPTFKQGSTTFIPKVMVSDETGGDIVSYASEQYGNGSNPFNFISFNRANGTKSFPTKMLDGEQVATVCFNGWDGKAVTPAFMPGFKQIVEMDADATDGSSPMSVTWIAQNLAAGTSSLFNLNSDGSVTIKGSGVATSTRTLLLDFASEINLATGSFLIAGGDPFDAIAPTSAKGDTIAHGTSGNESVSVGADGYAYIADSAASAGVSWRIPTSGLFSKVLPKSTVVNSTVETSIVGTIVGEKLIASGELQVGTTHTLRVTGLIKADSLNREVRIRVKYGAAVVADTGAITLATIITSQHFEIELDNIVIFATGAPLTGHSMCGGEFKYRDDSGTMPLKSATMRVENTTTLNTTVDNNLDVTVQWTTAEAGNELICETMTFSKEL